MAATAATAPVILVFFFVQKAFVEGVDPPHRKPRDNA
ncbi:hypothetical protein STENM223S_04247 [Streptomyces tendae]